MHLPSLYTRLGGYDGIVSFADNLLPRLQNDQQLGRFWAYRGADGVANEKQLLIDFLAHTTGGPMVYNGRNMKKTHAGMNISEDDWTIFLGHAGAAMDTLGIPSTEQEEIVTFVLSLKGDIVEA